MRTWHLTKVYWAKFDFGTVALFSAMNAALAGVYFATPIVAGGGTVHIS